MVVRLFVNFSSLNKYKKNFGHAFQRTGFIMLSRKKLIAFLCWAAFSGIFFGIGWIAFSEILILFGVENIAQPSAMLNEAPIYASIFFAVLFSYKYKVTHGGIDYKLMSIWRKIAINIFLGSIVLLSILNILTSKDLVQTFILAIAWAAVGFVIGGIISNKTNILLWR